MFLSPLALSGGCNVPVQMHTFMQNLSIFVIFRTSKTGPKNIENGLKFMHKWSASDEKIRVFMDLVVKMCKNTRVFASYGGVVHRFCTQARRDM